nr:phage portal protein [Microbacterium bovistercoris]
MVFAVSEGKLLAVQKPTYQAPTALRINDDLSEDYATLYRKQASVRTVVDFLARNIAQLSLQTFRRVDDNDRERVRHHPYAQLMRQPNPYTTGFRMMFSLIADRGIYDRALWVKAQQNGQDALVRIPPRLWTIADDDNWLAPNRFVIKGNRGTTTIDAARCVYFRGYNPEDERYGLSPIESLRRILSEEYAAGQMREQILRNGARISGYITRPPGSDWTDAARVRFSQGWRSQYAGHSATEAGGTPVLEDGMQFVPASQTATDLQYIEARKLSREEAAAAYFIPPPMVGILDHATFGNIEEQHKMLYQDTLGPTLQEVQQELKLQLLADFPDSDALYSEFNMLEKLRGSFEEQASQLQTSVGAPFLTRNEARARLNLPRIDGADDLVVPLNVITGGQASPTDSAPKSLTSAGDVRKWLQKALPAAQRRSVKSADMDTDQYAKLAQELLDRFFTRQRTVVLSALGAKAQADWWDAERWDKELSDDLYKLAVKTATELGRAQAEALGFSAGDYDEDRTLHFLRAVADSRAKAVNAATLQQVNDALDDDEADVGDVFTRATAQRSEAGAGAYVAALAGFAVVEVGKQLLGGTATKTWNTGPNPRASHAAMDGETVAIHESFSNGMTWPGDSAGGADEVAGCNCGVTVEYG